MRGHSKTGVSMKRALLIAGGTVGGLGAVLSITPPQLSSSGMMNLSGQQSGMPTTQATTQSAPAQATSAQVATATASTPAPSASASTTTNKKKVVGSKVSKKNNATVATSNSNSASVTQATPAPTQAAPSTPTPTPTKSSAPASSGANGSFTGKAVNVGYGMVQVKITVSNGKITDAQALQAPNGRSDRFTQYAVPILRQETLQAQSSQINSVSGASYTSWGWYTSLQDALAKAGM